METLFKPVSQETILEVLDDLEHPASGSDRTTNFVDVWQVNTP